MNWIIAAIPDAVKILDLGCGNGRLARALARAGRRVEYVGLDASAELIALARAHLLDSHVRAEFQVADLADPKWNRAFQISAFDFVIALGVLHHLPGFALRARVIADGARLLTSRGQILMTNWQFMNDARQQKKIAPWSLVGMDARNLEAGDALVTWKRGGVGYRYCHFITAAEIEKIAAQCALRVARQFVSDRNLNLCSILYSE
ncbi:MAG: class I SAM-dependent methyltransferase [Chloroflexi bacterium]|nr:class I SAM-dependent methyltransferase [Chloroflexota bacterium]